jgi:uncharacterized membrane protein YfcA
VTGLLLVTVLAVAAAMVQGSIGFGLALVMAPLLALIDPAFVPAPLLLASFPLSLLVVAREWRDVDLGDVPWALAGRLPGTVAGAAAVAAVPGHELQVLVAICVIVAVGLSLVPAVDVRPTPATLVGAGVISGFMGTAASVGGPPIALLYQRSPGPRIRATLALYFVFGTVLSLGALWLAGAVGRHELRLATELMPGTVIGFALSGLVKDHLDRGRMRTAVLGFAAASAVVLLVLALR